MLANRSSDNSRLVLPGNFKGATEKRKLIKCDSTFVRKNLLLLRHKICRNQVEIFFVEKFTYSKNLVLQSMSFEQLLQSKSRVYVTGVIQNSLEIVSSERAVAATTPDATSIRDKADECQKANDNGFKDIIEAVSAKNMSEETDSTSHESTAKGVVDGAGKGGVARWRVEMENKLAEAHANENSDNNSDGSSAQPSLVNEEEIQTTVERVLKKAEQRKELEAKETLQFVNKVLNMAEENKKVRLVQTQDSTEKGGDASSAKGEGIITPKNKSSTPFPAARSLSKASSGSTSSRVSRTVSVGLLGITVGSSTENNTSNGIFNLDKSVHREKRTVASSCPALSASRGNSKSKLFNDGDECIATLEFSARDDAAATPMCKHVSEKEAENVKPCDKDPSSLNDGNKAEVDMLKLAAYGDFIMYPDIQTSTGKDIFLIDPSKLPKKQEFNSKKEFKEFMGCLCSYAADFINANMKSGKFVLIIRAPNEETAKMKSGHFVKKFYKLVRDRLRDCLFKCVIYKPELKLKALLYISRPFFGNSLRKKFSIVKSPQKLVEGYGLPDTILHL